MPRQTHPHDKLSEELYERSVDKPLRITRRRLRRLLFWVKRNNFGITMTLFCHTYPRKEADHGQRITARGRPGREERNSSNGGPVSLTRFLEKGCAPGVEEG